MTTRAEHLKLDAYRKSIEALIALDHVAVQIAPRRPDLRDQLQRASASVVLNLAEGTGEFSPSEKARFYRMARRSATECQAALDIVDAVVRPEIETEPARQLASDVAAMLTGMVRAMEDRKR